MNMITGFGSHAFEQFRLGLAGTQAAAGSQPAEPGEQEEKQDAQNLDIQSLDIQSLAQNKMTSSSHASFFVKKDQELIGSERDVTDLDKQSTASGGRKDQALEQYRFFIHTASHENSDGVVKRIFR